MSAIEMVQACERVSIFDVCALLSLEGIIHSHFNNTGCILVDYYATSNFMNCMAIFLFCHMSSFLMSLFFGEYFDD
jgi:hypothetical protein